VRGIQRREAAPSAPIGRRSAAPGRRVVTTYVDYATMSLATAALVVDEAHRAVSARGRFRVAVAGGTTPAATYRFLATEPFAELVPWERTDLFWTDERCVSPRDPGSNERMERETLLDHVPIPPDRVYPMRCEIGRAEGRRSHEVDAAAVAQACAREYDALLSSLFPADHGPDTRDRRPRRVEKGRALDLVILGLGRDGHTAALFPGSQALHEEHTAAALFVEAGANAGTSVGDRDLWRITLTASFINRAASVVVLASGAGKAKVVREILQGPQDPTRLPAQMICPTGILHWHLDEEAAALLDGTPGGS
jgi:6-phosphogluconolactonase